VGTELVDISYDVSADTPTVDISIEVSSDGGSSYTVPATSLSGAIGAGVEVGTGKIITWDAGADWNEQSSSAMKIRVLVTEIDPPIPTDMALIPAGSFQKGDRFTSYFSSTDPVEILHVDKFYAGKYEVTKSKWDEVREWAKNSSIHFYDIGSTWDGTTWVPDGDGKAPDHPVYGVNGLKMAIWCNALSEMEGRTPCYTQDGEVYRRFRGITSEMALVECDFSANGYRLPTKVEWEKAARGGLTGKLFPWGDQISHASANYKEMYTYSTRGYNTPNGEDIEENSQGRIYHDSFDNNVGAVRPYTAPVGSFAPNGYGLYDVVGNVQDMTWDCEVPRSSIASGFKGLGGDNLNSAVYCLLSSGIGDDITTILSNGTIQTVVGFRIVISGDAPKQSYTNFSYFTLNTISARLPVLSLESYYESNSGESITIDATPTDGYPTDYSYQWYFNGVAIQAASGGVSNSYSINGINSNNGIWKVEVTNETGMTSAEFEYRVFTDSDGDGLSNYRESNITNTDPDLLDTDSDGLNDGAEINTHSTDPLVSDSSGDGLSDGAIVEAGFDPLVDHTNLINALSSDSLNALGYYSMSQLEDARTGAVMIEATGSTATLQLQIERSEDLTNWTQHEDDLISVPMQMDGDKQFFRFAMPQE
jgi:formylglycine-generating enzyme required for sulfatase activity